MAKKILQINFTFSGVSGSELKESWLPAAQPIADTPGLRWKVWLLNETQRECGGIYLFDDEASLQGFLNGPIVAATKGDPRLSNASVKMFDVMDEHTAITRGPVLAGVRV
ncbi:MAG: YdhR family protein [Caldilineaceae bacterium]